ncbi:MAG: hypothetical protein JJU42_04140 [Rhodobacteraceae bacterium]|nr:hypothetical protein [Paracoccaceae bacterium]
MPSLIRPFAMGAAIGFLFLAMTDALADTVLQGGLDILPVTGAGLLARLRRRQAAG